MTTSTGVSASHQTSFHIKFLRTELTQRQLRDPKFSLRAFAKTLGIDPSSLSRALSEKTDLSDDLAVKVCRNLSLTQDEKQRFIISLIDARSAKAYARMSKQLDILNFRSKDLVFQTAIPQQ